MDDFKVPVGWYVLISEYRTQEEAQTVARERRSIGHIVKVLPPVTHRDPYHGPAGWRLAFDIENAHRIRDRREVERAAGNGPH